MFTSLLNSFLAVGALSLVFLGVVDHLLPLGSDLLAEDLRTKRHIGFLILVIKWWWSLVKFIFCALVVSCAKELLVDAWDKSEGSQNIWGWTWGSVSKYAVDHWEKAGKRITGRIVKWKGKKTAEQSRIPINGT